MAAESLDIRGHFLTVHVDIRRLIMEMTTKDPSDRPPVAEVYDRLREVFMEMTGEQTLSPQPTHTPEIAVDGTPARSNNDDSMLSARVHAETFTLLDMAPLSRGHVIDYPSLSPCVSHVVNRYRYVPYSILRIAC